MAERLDDRDLERTLSDIGTRLGGTKRDLWPAVRTRIAERRARPWWSRLSIERGALAPVAATLAVILVEFKGTLETQFMAKAIGPGTTLDAVPLGGGVAYYLAGQPHQFFFRDPAGNMQPETLRLAGNTLLWEEGALTYRLEAQVSLEEAVRIASSLR